MIKNLLKNPLSKGLDLDDPVLTYQRQRVIQSNGFLKQIYLDRYGEIIRLIPNTLGFTLELGSGAGFFRIYMKMLFHQRSFFATS